MFQLTSPYNNWPKIDLDLGASKYHQHGYTGAKFDKILLQYADKAIAPAQLQFTISGTYGKNNSNKLQVPIGTVHMQEAPMSNCGVMMLTSPMFHYPITMDEKFGFLWMEIIEAYCAYRNRSLVLCSDRVGGTVDSFVSKYGQGWNHTEPVHNKNYSNDPNHKIKLMWKSVRHDENANKYFTPTE